MARFIDVHAEKRKALNLFQTVEPKVELVGRTVMMTGDMYTRGISNDVSTLSTVFPDEIPGYIARMSHASTGDAEANVKLTKKLLQFNPAHKTPFEFMQWVFKITGISKSCLTQMDRNRVGVGFVQMSGRYMDRSQSGFVYTAYAEKEWEVDYYAHPGGGSRESVNSAKCLLHHDSMHNEICQRQYEFARTNDCTKQDARKNLPLSQATGTYVYWNSSSLRQYFNERLRPAAEWEIRRVSQMMFDIVYAIAPAHFEDIKLMLDGEKQ